MDEERLEDEKDEVEEPQVEFGQERRGGQVVIDAGRGGQTVTVDAGVPFVSTLERIAAEFNYGGYYRVWLNGHEVLSPESAPETIEEGMRLAITPYDKVGLS